MLSRRIQPSRKAGLEIALSHLEEQLGQAVVDFEEGSR